MKVLNNLFFSRVGGTLSAAVGLKVRPTRFWLIIQHAGFWFLFFSCLLIHSALAQPYLALTSGNNPESTSANSKLNSITDFYGGILSSKNNTLQLGGIYLLTAPPIPEVATQAPLPLPLPTPTPEVIPAPAPLPTSEVAQKPILTPEPAPEIKVWINNRLYQKELVEKGEKFIISKQPKIKIEVSIAEPYALDSRIENYSIQADAGTAAVKTFSLQSTQAIKTLSAKTASIEYALPSELSEGAHTFDFSAKSSGAKGIPSIGNLKISVAVMGGPISITDTPITFPSPFSPTKNKAQGITIQYTLSDNAEVEIYIFSVSGEKVKKISCLPNAEGGTAGLNKVKWDGSMDAGGIIGNGIYSGAIISKQEGKRLAKFMLNVFD